jgi:hypothetical protein
MSASASPEGGMALTKMDIFYVALGVLAAVCFVFALSPFF